MNNRKAKKQIDRRDFLHSAAATGAGLVLSPMAFGQSANKKPDDINVALLGAGRQGQVLMNTCLKMIPGIRFKAVCDIWTAYNQRQASRILKAYKHENNAYVDYKQMLDKEKDLDAVIIATPDFWHAEHTVACLKAGLDVYCEKEMSNTLEGARRMVQAAKETGKLLQIGHQHLCSCRDRQERTQNQTEFERNPANSQHCTLRESLYYTSTYENYVAKRKSPVS